MPTGLRLSQSHSGLSTRADTQVSTTDSSAPLPGLDVHPATAYAHYTARLCTRHTGQNAGEKGPARPPGGEAFTRLSRVQQSRDRPDTALPTPSCCHLLAGRNCLLIAHHSKPSLHLLNHKACQPATPHAPPAGHLTGRVSHPQDSTQLVGITVPFAEEKI